MGKLVYHYTTFDSFRGIIGEKICLWATRYDHLNDPSEQIWASNVLLSSLSKRDEFKGEDFNDYKEFFSVNSYVISLCKKADYRNMWRLYCNDGFGLCLCFDSDYFKKQCYSNLQESPNDSFDIYNEVEYSNRRQIDFKIEICSRRESFNLVDEEEASRLMSITPFIKNDDFSIEKEIRYARCRRFGKITIPYDRHLKGPGKIVKEMNTKGEKIRMRRNELVPYVEIYFPAKALKKIIVGYETDFEKAKKFIEGIIAPYKKDYGKIEIVPSRLFSSKLRTEDYKCINQ